MNKNQFIMLLFSIAMALSSCEQQDLTIDSIVESSTFDLAKLSPDDFIHADNFVESVTNLYFPLNIGDTSWYVLTAIEEGEIVVEESYVTVTAETKIIEGISCMVIRDFVTVDGVVSEDTYDWYAQDKYGNIWYLGEDTKKYNDDGSYSTAGSFEHGVDGAVGGLFMLANPEEHIGYHYQQENYAGLAEDMAKIVSVGETIEIGLGVFTNCVKTAETSPLVPGELAYKYYAPGFGQIYSYTAVGTDEEQELVGTNF